MAEHNFERPGIHKNAKHFNGSADHRGGTSTQIFSAVGTGASIAQPCNSHMFPTSTYYREQGTVSSSGEKIQAGSRSVPFQEHLSARPLDNGEVMKTLPGKGSRHDQSGLREIHSRGTYMEAENKSIRHAETIKNDNEVKEEKIPLTKVLYKLIQISKEKQLPDVTVIFEQSRDGAEDVVCTLQGSSDNIKQFKRVIVDMGKKLIKKELIFSTETTRMLHDIHLEDSINMQLEDKYPGCIVEQRHNVICLFGFDRNEIDRAKHYVCLLIRENSHLLTGDLRNKSPLVQDHFNHKFKNRIVARVCNFRLYMVGLKEAIDEANCEFVEISEGRKSLCATETFDSKEITQKLRVEEALKCQFLVKSSLLQDVVDTFKVTIYPKLAECTFDVQGSKENVTLAMERLCKIVTYLITVYRDISFAESVNYFTMALKDKRVQSLMAQFNVHMHINYMFSCGTIQVKKEPQPDSHSCIWTGPDGTLLVLECFTLDNVKADLLYVPVNADRGTIESKRILHKAVKDRRLVEIALPDFIPSETSVLHTVEKTVDQAIMEAGKDKIKSVAFAVSPFGMWTDTDLMQCIVNSSVEWFLHPQNEFPSSVLLCTQKEECCFLTDEYIDRCLQRQIQRASGVKEQPIISVIQGYVDKAEADVIVNTTDSSLNLKHGNVSSALLRAAGNQLQTECSEKFPRGIKPNDIVMTDGYNLKCKKVFHISLQAQARATEGFIHEEIIRRTMLVCLKKASDKGYRSMVFPALGTGTLNYPTKSVASEMLMSVERFVKQCPSTTLREITFVIHPKDVDVFKTFSRLKEKIVPKSVDVNVKLEIVGMENNVKNCMEFLRPRQTNVGTDVNVHATGFVSASPVRLSSQMKTDLPIHASSDRKYQCGHVSIRVYEADILSVPVACIVNAENGDLQQGTLPVTHIEETAARNLPFRFIIHAVWPCFDDYKPCTKSNLDKYAQDLKQTVLNCFFMADKNAIKTIALPAISSGNFQVSNEICAVQYAQAVAEFSSNCHSLKEIHFVDTSPDMINTIYIGFDAIIVQKKSAPFSIDHHIEHTTVNESTEISERNKETMMKNTGRDKPNFQKSFMPYSEQSDLSKVNAEYISEKSQTLCTFAMDNEQKVKVIIKEGDIVNLTGLTAIVCSEGRAGEGKGVVARLLLEKGGEEYRQLKALQFTCHRKYGEVFTTPGGNNNYTWIIHAIISRHDPKYFANFYRNIFEEIQRRKFESVALPLIGTGVGSLDPQSSAEMLVREVIQFCKTKGKGTLTIHVVINDNLTVNVVKDVFKRMSSKRQEKEHEQFDDTSSPHIEQKTFRMGDTFAKSIESDAGEDCVICMDKLTNAEKLKCGHRFCKECIEGYFKVKQVCPTCGKVCGTITGDQPEGSLDLVQRLSSVAGYENCGSISITYHFGNGIQGPDHPRPGAPFKGITRTAYLPNNPEGREVCAMLKVAFQRRLVFTIGTSRTTGKEGVITWNDIHHKTDPRPNTQFGYPDKTYLQRVREELAIKGVTEQDVEKELMKKLEIEGFRQSFTSDNK